MAAVDSCGDDVLRSLDDQELVREPRDCTCLNFDGSPVAREQLESPSGRQSLRSHGKEHANRLIADSKIAGAFANEPTVGPDW